MTRHVMQISTDNDRLFALCDDGTLWMLDVLDTKGACAEWEPLPEIPQPEIENG